MTCNTMSTQEKPLEAIPVNLFQGVHMKNHKCCGLLVHEQWAIQFLAPKESRKVYEIRKNPLKMLSPGDRIILVSMRKDEVAGRVRECIAILEYQGCTSIRHEDFAMFFSLHRVPDRSYQQMRNEWKGDPGHCWAWHFRLIHELQPRLRIPRDLSSGCEQCFLYVDVGRLERVSSTYSTPFFCGDGNSPTQSEGLAIHLLDHGPSHSSEQSTVAHDVWDQSPVAPDVCEAADLDVDMEPQEEEGEDASVCESPGCDPEDPSSVGGQLASLSESEEHYCIVLQEKEWLGLLKGSSGFLRSFKIAKSSRLIAILKKEFGYYAVAFLCVSACDTLVYSLRNMSPFSNVYDRDQLQQMKSWKNVFHIQLNEIEKFDAENAISFVNNKHRNRIFKLSTFQLCKGMSRAPAAMNLTETARYFMDCCGDEGRSEILRQVQQLGESGKTKLRVATACSGSDICITVLEQTIAYLNTQQAGYT